MLQLAKGATCMAHAGDTTTSRLIAILALLLGHQVANHNRGHVYRVDETITITMAARTIHHRRRHDYNHHDHHHNHRLYSVGGPLFTYDDCRFSPASQLCELFVWEKEPCLGRRHHRHDAFWQYRRNTSHEGKIRPSPLRRCYQTDS